MVTRRMAREIWRYWCQEEREKRVPEGGEGGDISGRDTCQDERDRKDLMIGREEMLAQGF